MIEVVHDAETIAKLQKTKGVTATFAKNCIWDWLKEYHVTEDWYVPSLNRQDLQGLYQVKVFLQTKVAYQAGT